MAANILAIALAVVTTLVLRRQNSLADQGKVVLEGLAEFRYTP
jgi:hypothetical protein